jgi:hypothetical protein
VAFSAAGRSNSTEPAAGRPAPTTMALPFRSKGNEEVLTEILQMNPKPASMWQKWLSRRGHSSDVERYPLCHSRHSGPASSRSGGRDFEHEIGTNFMLKGKGLVVVTSCSHRGTLLIPPRACRSRLRLRSM